MRETDRKTNRKRETDTQTNIDTNRQRSRYTSGQARRQADKQMASLLSMAATSARSRREWMQSTDSVRGISIKGTEETIGLEGGTGLPCCQADEAGALAYLHGRGSKQNNTRRSPWHDVKRKQQLNRRQQAETNRQAATSRSNKRQQAEATSGSSRRRGLTL